MLFIEFLLQMLGLLCVFLLGASYGLHVARKSKVETGEDVKNSEGPYFATSSFGPPQLYDKEQVEKIREVMLKYKARKINGIGPCQCDDKPINDQ